MSKTPSPTKGRGRQSKNKKVEAENVDTISDGEEMDPSEKMKIVVKGKRYVPAKVVLIGGKNWKEKIIPKPEIDKVAVSGVKKSFQCELCSDKFFSQIDFFHHLQNHYASPEPEQSSNASFLDTTSSGLDTTSSVLDTSSSPKPVDPTNKSKKVESRTNQLLEAKITKTTRSGRVSKPRPRDIDMVYISPVKKEPKQEIEVQDEVEDLLEDQFEPEADELYQYDQEDNVNVVYEFISSEVTVEETDVDLVEEAEMDEVNDEGQFSSGEKIELKKGLKEPKPKKEKVLRIKVEKPKRELMYTKVQNEENGSIKYQCNFCNKLYASTSSITIHTRIHLGVKPLMCQDCGKCFRQMSDLKYHQAIHDEKKNFQCEFCSKEFSRKYSLTLHRKIHTGVKDFKCPTCGKEFRSSSKLQEHCRVHTGEKPYSCDVCGQRFSQSFDMKKHRLKIHHMPIHPSRNDENEETSFKIASVRHIRQVRANNGFDVEAEEVNQNIDVTISEDDATTDEEEEQQKRLLQNQQRQKPVKLQKQRERKLVFLSETEAIYI